MLLTLLSTLMGAGANLLPSIMNYFEARQKHEQEMEMARLQMEAAKQNVQLNIQLENVKADISEGQSIRDHDAALDGGSFINALRASVRPVITYLFFFLFCAIKVCAVYVMMDKGMPLETALPKIWDEETISLFAAIIGFWFGSRTIASMKIPKK
jgi:hypothetical protein